MKFATAVKAGALLLAGLARSAEARNAVTPIEKVLQLLNGMVANAKKDKHEEQVEFAKFQQWCSGTQASTTRSIAEAKARIEALTAEIGKAKADAEVLAKEIGQLQAATAKATDEFNAAKAVRDTEHADYEAQHKDFSESIEAAKRAVEVLKAKSAAVPQSLLEVRSLRRAPQQLKDAVDTLLQQAPQANAYEFQSGGVVQLLEKLTLDFEDQLLALEKAEISAKANYDLLAQQLTDNIKSFTADTAKKTGLKASRQERAAAATGELEATKTAKAQDEKTLADTIAECASRSAAFEKDQGTRADEVKALETAIGIMSSDAVSLAQQTASASSAPGSALVQLRSSVAQRGAEARQRLVEFLQERSSKLGSRYLELAAARAAEDPFAKIKAMIADMITKLSEEAISEAEHHGYCHAELEKNKLVRENKASEVEELAARRDQLAADSARLAGEIAELSASVADLRQAQAEATKIRNEERAANAKTIAEAREGQTAVAKATEVLKDFYGKAGASLLQGGESLAEEMSRAGRAPYKGQQSESTGVFGLLEVILSDFARVEAQTASAEDQAQSTYERFLAESGEDLAVKLTTIEHNEKRKRQADEAALSTKKELDLTQAELDSALEYYEKLKVDCNEVKIVSYEDKVKARNEEIKSLQEALTMLAQQDLA